MHEATRNTSALAMALIQRNAPQSSAEQQQRFTPGFLKPPTGQS
jgi:hypothetical protein